MSSIINNETNQLLNTVNHEIHQEDRSVKRGQALIAEANRAQAQAAKDRIIPSTGEGEGVAVAKGKVPGAKPQLPPTTTQFNGFRGSGNESEEGNQTLGLIAIIGECMSLQAKSNSNFWSTMWKQASESMMMQVKYAPVIGDAVNSAYTAQSLSTSAQASQSEQDGIFSLLTFGGAVLTAGLLPADETEVTQGSTKVVNETTENVGSEQLNNPIDNANDEIEQEENVEEQVEMNQVANGDNNPSGTGLKRIGKAGLDVAGGGKNKLVSVLTKGMQSAQLYELASKGIQGYFVDSKYQGIQSREQALEGQAQAVSKESEQYSQFYGQSFSRSDQLTSAGQQNIDYAMNILKSAADTITGTVTSMFRG